MNSLWERGEKGEMEGQAWERGTVFRTVVRPEWIDYNGHMNVAYYVLAFDHAIDVFYDALGLGRSYAESGLGSMFALALKVDYVREVREGDPLVIRTWLVDADHKRIHYAQTMEHAEQGYLAARKEGLSIHVDLASRRSAPFSPEQLSRIEALWKRQGARERPDWVGQVIGIRGRHGS